MKERPILMTPENAQKCFDGSKTQTRRIIKPQPNIVHAWDGEWLATNQIFRNRAPGLRCPYGVVGYRLWIREAHQFDPPDDGTWGYTVFMGCKGAPLEDIPSRFRTPAHCLYRGKWDGSPLIWRPSLHMPRWACRTVVEITEIRVQRLNEISEEDAKAEGCINNLDEMVHGGDGVYANALGHFVRLWTSINGPDSWDANPFVWAITFKKVIH